MTTSSLIRRLEALKTELPHRLHGRLERLADDIRAQGVEVESESDETPPTSGLLGGGEGEPDEADKSDEPSDAELVIPVDFLKAEVVLRPSDGQKLGAIWFQEDGLSGGRIVKLGLTLAGLDELMRAVADVAMQIETGIE